MVKKSRSLIISPLGKLTRASVQEAVDAVHVFPSLHGQWEVKEIGAVGHRKRFSSKKSALDFAERLAVKKQSSLLVHDKRARLKVGAREKNIVYEIGFEES